MIDVNDKSALNQSGGPDYGTATVGPTNTIGLSGEEFDEFLNISMDIAPKNIKLDMDYDSEPLLKVSLIVKFFFVSVTDKTAEKKFEDSLDPKNFEKCHLIPVPTIQYLNGRTRTNDDEPIIKKQRLSDKKKERIDELFKRAMNHVDPDNKTGSDEAKSDEAKSEFKPELFKATQLYDFQAPIAKWSIAAQQFPVDIHRIRFAFQLQPLNAYSDANKTLFELIVPGRKSTDRKLLSKKENFYPNIEVEKFPSNADTMVSESILEFDIMPNSLKIGSTSPRSKVTKKTNFIITFKLTRHVLGPSLNALVPIYVIAFLTPFTCFFDLTGPFDEVAGYLVTLLLTLVAHRLTISDAQTAIMRFTISDVDFVIGFAFVVIQMIIFVGLFTNNDAVEMDEYDIWTLFTIEEMIVALWVVSRIIGIVIAYNRLVNENEVDLMETNDTMSSDEYRTLRADRKQLSQELGKEVYLKSLYSINTKILLREGLENENTTSLNHGRTRLPTNDVFRCCLVKTDTKTNTVLLNLDKNDKFDVLYPKQIVLPEEKRKEGKKAAKVVYKYTPTHGKTLLLEVQFLSHGDSFTTKSHREYKKENLEKALKILQENPRTALRKGKVVRMYLQSLWVEIFSVSRHNFLSKCKSDWDLLCLTWQQLGKLKIGMGEEQAKVRDRTQASTLSDVELSESSERIQNLLDTGEFKKPKTA